MAKRILIVDDEPEVCEIISGYLDKRGFTTERAHNGEEALDIINRSKPDLIILDVLMPKMGGLALLRHLKTEESLSQIPVIILTIKSGSEDLDTGISSGADFYLPKPFNLDNLMEFIRLTI